MNEKPGNVQLIGIFMLVSGVLNVIAGIILAGLIIIGTVGIGLLCLPILLLPVGLGVFEIITGAGVINGKPTKNVQLVGGLEIASILWLNVLSMVAGILNLVFYSDDETRAYFER